MTVTAQELQLDFGKEWLKVRLQGRLQNLGKESHEVRPTGNRVKYFEFEAILMILRFTV